MVDQTKSHGQLSPLRFDDFTYKGTLRLIILSLNFPMTEGAAGS